MSATTCYPISGATLTDSFGTFKTISGAFTPNQGTGFTGDQITGVVSGPMSGTTFTGLAENVFSYTYRGDGQQWVDSSSDSDGQVAAAGNITG